MADWTAVEQTATGPDGSKVALVGGKWVPATQTATGPGGKRMALLGDSAPAKPIPELKEDYGAHPWVTKFADAMKRASAALPSGSAAEPGFGVIKATIDPIATALGLFGTGGLSALRTGSGMTTKPRPETMEAALALTPMLASGAGKAMPIIERAAGRATTEFPVVARRVAKAIKPTTGADVNKALTALRAGGDDVLRGAGSPRLMATESQVGQRAAEGVDRAVAGAEASDLPKRQFDATQALAAHERETQAAGPRLLAQHLGDPKTADEIGNPLKSAVTGRREAAYSERTAEANRAYTKTRDVGMAKEAAGEGFEASDPGKKLLTDLRRMLESENGHDQLADSKRAKINELIGTISGGGGGGKGMQAEMNALAGEGEKKLPAGIGKLMDEYRELRNFKPGEAPAMGKVAVDKVFARQLADRLETAMNDWSSEWEKANQAYRSASDKLRAFQTGSVGGALKGEAFDYYDPAMAAADFPGRFFKNTQTVQELRDALGDDKAVQRAAIEHASSSLRGKTPEAADKWAWDNRAWLREAGADDAVDRYVKGALDAQTAAGTKGTALKAETDRVAGLRGGEKETLLKAQGRSTEAATAVGQREKARAALVPELHKMFGSTTPKELASQWRTLSEKAQETGAITADQAQSLTRQIDEISRIQNKAERNAKIAKWIIRIGGISALGYGVIH